MTYTAHLREDRRLVILRVLSEMPGYTANESILHDMVVSWGNRCSRDQVRTEMAWLADQDLIKNSDMGGLYVAEIKRHGQEVASGLSEVPGVRKPSPEA